MREGDIILTPLPQSDGVIKNRPALLLRELPPFGDYLACGISSQVRHALPEFDEVILQTDPEFAATGLIEDSVIRLGFLAALPRRKILGAIGEIGPGRRARLLKNLCTHLLANSDEPSN